MTLRPGFDECTENDQYVFAQLASEVFHRKIGTDVLERRIDGGKVLRTVLPPIIDALFSEDVERARTLAVEAFERASGQLTHVDA